jgi:hypothetical protein
MVGVNSTVTPGTFVFRCANGDIGFALRWNDAAITLVHERSHAGRADAKPNMSACNITDQSTWDGTSRRFAALGDDGTRDPRQAGSS